MHWGAIFTIKLKMTHCVLGVWAMLMSSYRHFYKKLYGTMSAGEMKPNYTKVSRQIIRNNAIISSEFPLFGARGGLNVYRLRTRQKRYRHGAELLNPSRRR